MLYIAIVLFVLVTTGLAVLAFENFLNDVSLSLVVWHLPPLPVGWLLLLVYLLGAVMLFLIAATAAAQDARELRSLRERVKVLGERVAAAEAPEATISNGSIQSRLYLPDAQRGYYRGTRFDWSGVIYSLRYKGHEYFGPWFDKYDPNTHDAITGPVEA